MSESESNKNEQFQNPPKNSFFLKKILSDFFLGIWDSFKIFTTYDIIFKNQKIYNNVINCIILNGFLFIGSMILYIYVLGNLIDYLAPRMAIISYFLVIGKYFYYLLWLIPVFILCNIITTFWTDEIYFESLEIIENNKNIKVEGQDFITIISNQIERLLIVACFAIFIAMINFFSFVPGLFVLKYVTMSILNSVYVFEYILLQKYIRNYKSIMYFIENKFFYFLGFGMILTVMINIIDSVTINSSIFLIAFPFFLIASIKVNHIRFDEYREINKNSLIFFYLIEKIYKIGIKMLSFLFEKLRKKKSI
jgi:etoposide-induced 2.4 mRNA